MCYYIHMVKENNKGENDMRVTNPHQTTPSHKGYKTQNNAIKALVKFSELAGMRVEGNGVWGEDGTRIATWMVSVTEQGRFAPVAIITDHSAGRFPTIEACQSGVYVY